MKSLSRNKLKSESCTGVNPDLKGYACALKGFTLLEILVSCCILSAILAAIFGVFSVGNECWNIDTVILDLRQQARLAMDGMSREIRQSQPSSITITDGGARINFSIGANPLSYYLENRRLIREHTPPGGVKRVLGNDMSSLNFSLSNSTMRIQMELEDTAGGKNITIPLATRLRLRNE